MIASGIPPLSPPQQSHGSALHPGVQTRTISSACNPDHRHQARGFPMLLCHERHHRFRTRFVSLRNCALSGPFAFRNYATWNGLGGALVRASIYSRSHEELIDWYNEPLEVAKRLNMKRQARPFNPADRWLTFALYDLSLGTSRLEMTTVSFIS